jgi:Holliday junction resolvase
MSNATRGIYLERRVAEILAKDGWFTIRAAGSHGIADVVAIAPGQVVFIQCKTAGVMRGGEWNRLYVVAMAMGATPVLAQYASETHRAILFLEITGEHTPRSKSWPHHVWDRAGYPHLPPLDRDTMARVQELELERLNRVPGRW